MKKTVSISYLVGLFLFAAAFCAGARVNGQAYFTQGQMEQAAAYSAQMGGAAVMILQNDSIVFEDYHEGYDASVVTHIRSATKGFWALTAGICMEKGWISDYNERVALTIREWLDTDRHPNKNLITVNDLLTLSSGLSQDVDNIQGENAAAADIYQYVADSLRLVSAPGNRFQYGPSHYYAFGVFLERKLEENGIRQNPLEFLDSMIFQPIGLEYDDWVHDQSGNPHIPNGCYLSPRNWMKFGKLMLQKGNWEGEQLVDSALVQELLVADGPNPGHGKFLWQNNIDGYGAYTQFSAPPGSSGGFMYHDGYTEIIGALGAGKNRMYIIPSLHTVVLRQSVEDTGNFDDHTFLSFLLDKTVTATEENSLEYRRSLIYPNPATDFLSIEVLRPEDFEILEVLNVTGHSLLQKKIDSFNSRQTINISYLPNGVYFLRLSGPLGTESKKFIKR